jgi:hypothetical protein
MLRFQYNKHHRNGHKYLNLQHHMDHQKRGEQNIGGEELLIHYHDCCRANPTQQQIRGEMG